MFFRHLPLLVGLGFVISGCGEQGNGSLWGGGVSIQGTGGGKGGLKEPNFPVEVDGNFKWNLPFGGFDNNYQDNCDGIERVIRFSPSKNLGHNNSKKIINVDILVKNNTRFFIADYSNLPVKFISKKNDENIVEQPNNKLIQDYQPGECKLYKIKYELEYSKNVHQEWSFNYDPKYYVIQNNKVLDKGFKCKAVSDKIIYNEIQFNNEEDKALNNFEAEGEINLYNEDNKDALLYSYPQVMGYKNSLINIFENNNNRCKFTITYPTIVIK
jgi:hypothetical protein